MDVENDFKKLRKLMLLEEFKNCLPSEVETYIEEQKTAKLRQAAVQSDNHLLTTNHCLGRLVITVEIQ